MVSAAPASGLSSSGVLHVDRLLGREDRDRVDHAGDQLQPGLYCQRRGGREIVRRVVGRVLPVIDVGGDGRQALGPAVDER